MDEAQRRRMRDGLRRKGRRQAEARRCPACGRGAALIKSAAAWPTVYVCRYCRHEHTAGNS